MLDFLFSGIVAVISGIVWLAFSAFMIWMILECALHETRDGNERLVWIIITVFVPYLGAVRLLSRSAVRSASGRSEVKVEVFEVWTVHRKAASDVRDIADRGW